MQIDPGRIGGISAASRVARYAERRRVSYLNHTFRSHLSLAAALQPYAEAAGALCEYPLELSPLAASLTTRQLTLQDGHIQLPEAPGLGLEVALATVARYLVPVEIRLGGRRYYLSPEL